MSGPVRLLEGGNASFHLGLFDTTPAATPTDLLLLKGAANRVFKIRRILVSGIATTAGDLPILLIKRTADNTAGTRAAQSAGKADSADASASALQAFLYTVNASSLGASAGTLRARRLFLNLATAAKSQVEFVFGNSWSKPIYLRGASEYLAINANGAALPAGAKLDFEVDWTEGNP